jgi:hypothetical protein
MIPVNSCDLFRTGSHRRRFDPRITAKTTWSFSQKSRTASEKTTKKIQVANFQWLVLAVIEPEGSANEHNSLLQESTSHHIQRYSIHTHTHSSHLHNPSVHPNVDTLEHCSSTFGRIWYTILYNTRFTSSGDKHSVCPSTCNRFAALQGLDGSTDTLTRS